MAKAKTRFEQVPLKKIEKLVEAETGKAVASGEAQQAKDTKRAASKVA